MSGKPEYPAYLPKLPSGYVWDSDTAEDEKPVYFIQRGAEDEDPTSREDWICLKFTKVSGKIVTSTTVDVDQWYSEEEDGAVWTVLEGTPKEAVMKALTLRRIGIGTPADTQS